MNNKYAVVTGGAGSLGAEITKMLTDTGVTVFIFDKNLERGNALAGTSKKIVFHHLRRMLFSDSRKGL